MKKHIFTLLILSSRLMHAQSASDDPYQWLEEVDNKQALEFVEKQNKITVDKLSQEKNYKTIYDKSLEIFNSTDRIAYPSIDGDFIYNFWQDQDHARGIWRRSSKASYLSGNPAWETMIDLDEMSKKDNVKWVFKGDAGLYPHYNRFLIFLSKGGGDAVVIKEFDAAKKAFVEEGFSLPESKGSASYLDENTLIVTTDFGNNSMTTSGYPRQVKLWKRGTPLKDAQLIFEGETTDVSSSAYVMRDDKDSYLFVSRGITFYEGKSYVWHNNKLIQLDIPDDCQGYGLLKNQFIVGLKSDWTVNGKTYKQGDLLSLNFSELISGKKEVRLILHPDEFTSVQGISTTKNKLLVNTITNVRGELFIYTTEKDSWKKEKVNAPEFGTIGLNASDEFSDLYFFSYSDFLTPSTLYQANAQDNTVKAYKSLPSYFDASKFKIEQFKVRSKDGTMVPYFVISSKALKYDGSNPTLLYGYGGFEVSMLPYYLAVVGRSWLENGGVYVLSNIRGGGEFGPKWHIAGLKEHRQRVYDDFNGIAEDLIAKKITSGKHLGIMGGSNGGLLMGVAFTQRPDLYHAVVCQVPLLDMKRYSKLLAGASWMGEYGDPDKPEEWEYIKKYSPYQNLEKGKSYPEVFFTTSTRDDRVHPGHARKMVAKMIDMGYPVYYFENTEGGHAGSSTNEQRAKTAALQYSYLLMKLKG